MNEMNINKYADAFLKLVDNTICYEDESMSTLESMFDVYGYITGDENTLGIRKLSQAIIKQEKQILNLEDKLAECDEEIADLISRVKDKNQQLESLLDEKNLIEADYHKVMEINKDYVESINEMSKAFRKSERDIEELNDTITKFRNEELSNKDMYEQSQQYHLLKVDNKKLREELEKARAEIKRHTDWNMSDWD